MSRVLTLIVKPGDQESLRAAVMKAQTLLTSAGAHLEAPIVLAPHEALDLPFSPSRALAADQILEGLSEHKVDACIQETHLRGKRLLLADMDSTIIENECIDELADFAGVKADVAKITERAMAGELKFEDSLIERVALLKALPESVLQTCFEERIQIRPGAKTLIQTAKNLGLRCVLVSGGFTFFTSLIREAVGFDADIANQLEVRNGALTGTVVPPLSGPSTKFETLEREVERLGISAKDVIAVGDGANDIPMLEAAGLGVAVHAKEKTKAAADIAVEHGDLTALLYLMGVPKSSFAQA